MDMVYYQEPTPRGTMKKAAPGLECQPRGVTMFCRGSGDWRS